MSKAELDSFVKKGNPEVSKTARKAEKARAAAVTMAAAAVLNTANVQAQEQTVQDAQTVNTEHVITVENDVRQSTPPLREGDVNFADYAQSSPEKGNIAEKLGLETIVDGDGKAYYFSGDNIVEPQKPGQQKRKYNREQKEAFKSEEAGQIVEAEVGLEEITNSTGDAIEMGSYDLEAKYTTLNKLVVDKDSNNVEQQNKVALHLNNETTRESVAVHEKQHETNDRLNSYAPGLSPQQIAITNMNDEMAANTAQLYLCIHNYQESLKSGASQEEALKAFDKDEERFGFYREALANGLDPNSEEGKKLMVQGVCDMWQEKYAEIYAEQLTNAGTKNVERDLPGTVVGNQKEMERRIIDMFDHICDNDYCKEHGIKSPGKLSQYLEMDKVTKLPDNIRDKVNDSIDKNVEYQTGFSQEERNAAANSLTPEKSDKAKQRELVRNLRKGLSAEEKQAKEAAKKERAQQKTQEASIDIAQIAAQQRGNSNG